MKSENLKSLLKNNKSAKNYFKALPTSAQNILKRTAGDIETEEELCKYADDIFHSSGMMM